MLHHITPADDRTVVSVGYDGTICEWLLSCHDLAGGNHSGGARSIELGDEDEDDDAEAFCRLHDVDSDRPTEQGAHPRIWEQYNRSTASAAATAAAADIVGVQLTTPSPSSPPHKFKPASATTATYLQELTQSIAEVAESVSREADNDAVSGRLKQALQGFAGGQRGGRRHRSHLQQIPSSAPASVQGENPRHRPSASLEHQRVQSPVMASSLPASAASAPMSSHGLMLVLHRSEGSSLRVGSRLDGEISLCSEASSSDSSDSDTGPAQPNPMSRGSDSRVHSSTPSAPTAELSSAAVAAASAGYTGGASGRAGALIGQRRRKAK